MKDNKKEQKVSERNRVFHDIGHNAVLFNLTSENSLNWGEKKKANWLKIYNVSLENLPPECLEPEAKQIAEQNYQFVIDEIEFIKGHNELAVGYEVFILLKGGDLMSYMLYDLFRESGYRIAVPTFKGESKNKFINWRFL